MGFGDNGLKGLYSIQIGSFILNQVTRFIEKQAIWAIESQVSRKAEM